MYLSTRQQRQVKDGTTNRLYADTGSSGEQRRTRACSRISRHSSVATGQATASRLGRSSHPAVASCARRHMSRYRLATARLPNACSHVSLQQSGIA